MSPNGLLQATTADPGAFDECIETVFRDQYGIEQVRGQYCNFHVRMGDDRSIIEEIMPAALLSHRRMQNFTSYLTDPRLPGLRLGICMINDCTQDDLQSIVDSPVLMKCLTSFSIIKNTKLILAVNKNKSSETYQYRFIHGLKFLSMVWIVLGHSYGIVTDNMSRMVNALHYFEHWYTLIVTAGYLGVDIFFFFSGFLLYYTLNKQTRNRMFVAIVAVFSRFLRTTVPMFFVIMCMYLLPLIASGPDSNEFYTKFYREIKRHWWDLLLQLRNWRQDIAFSTLQHVWYISADFQLFLLSVVIIQVFKNKKWWAACIFAVLSVVSCGISAWQVHGNHIPPFMVPVAEELRDPTSETGKVFFAFSDRMVWSVCLAWITFACSTGRGGILNRFLSWDGFVPLSRLSFGVYLIHFPFYLFTYHIARERVFFSHFTLVSQCFSVLVWSHLLSYFMFIACEAPTDHLRKLLFMRERNSAVKTAPGPEEHVQAERIEDGFNGRYGNVVVKANTPDQKPNSFNILSYSL
ncbi:nose resistant to fluoxetine protein 6 [Ixodes scapularis]